MAGHRIRSNDPGGRVPAVEGGGSEMVLVATRGPSNVRRRQRRLWAVAKRSPGRRFHALYDRVDGDDVLWEAWERVRRNRGAAGGYPDGARPGGAAGGEAGVGADLRGRLLAGLLRLPAEAFGDGGVGA